MACYAVVTYKRRRIALSIVQSENAFAIKVKEESP
jgi:hypothetical protein